MRHIRVKHKEKMTVKARKRNTKQKSNTKQNRYAKPKRTKEVMSLRVDFHQA